MKKLRFLKDGVALEIVESGSGHTLTLDGKTYDVNVDFENGKIEVIGMCDEEIKSKIKTNRLSIIDNGNSLDAADGEKPTVSLYVNTTADKNDYTITYDTEKCCVSCLSDDERQNTSRVTFDSIVSSDKIKKIIHEHEKAKIIKPFDSDTMIMHDNAISYRIVYQDETSAYSTTVEFVDNVNSQFGVITPRTVSISYNREHQEMIAVNQLSILSEALHERTLNVDLLYIYNFPTSLIDDHHINEAKNINIEIGDDDGFADAIDIIRRFNKNGTVRIAVGNNNLALTIEHLEDGQKHITIWKSSSASYNVTHLNEMLMDIEACYVDDFAPIELFGEQYFYSQRHKERGGGALHKSKKICSYGNKFGFDKATFYCKPTIETLLLDEAEIIGADCYATTLEGLMSIESGDMSIDSVLVPPSSSGGNTAPIETLHPLEAVKRIINGNGEIAPEALPFYALGNIPLSSIPQESISAIGNAGGIGVPKALHPSTKHYTGDFVYPTVGFGGYPRIGHLQSLNGETDIKTMDVAISNSMNSTFMFFNTLDEVNEDMGILEYVKGMAPIDASYVMAVYKAFLFYKKTIFPLAPFTYSRLPTCYAFAQLKDFYVFWMLTNGIFEDNNQSLAKELLSGKPLYLYNVTFTGITIAGRNSAQGIKIDGGLFFSKEGDAEKIIFGNKEIVDTYISVIGTMQIVQDEETKMYEFINTCPEGGISFKPQKYDASIIEGSPSSHSVIDGSMPLSGNTLPEPEENNIVEYQITSLEDGEIEISWINKSDISPTFFHFNGNKIILNMEEALWQ